MLLNELTSDGSDPSYSPDGERIIFATDRDRNGRLCYADQCSVASELYVMDADGRHESQLTSTKAVNEAAPAWSPDGEQIAYQSGRVTDNAQGTSIFVIDPAGSCRLPVLLDPNLRTWYVGPAWRAGAAPGAMHCPEKAITGSG